MEGPVKRQCNNASVQCALKFGRAVIGGDESEVRGALGDCKQVLGTREGFFSACWTNQESPSTTSCLSEVLSLLGGLLFDRREGVRSVCQEGVLSWVLSGNPWLSACGRVVVRRGVRHPGRSASVLRSFLGVLLDASLTVPSAQSACVLTREGGSERGEFGHRMLAYEFFGLTPSVTARRAAACAGSLIEEAVQLFLEAVQKEREGEAGGTVDDSHETAEAERLLGVLVERAETIVGDAAGAVAGPLTEVGKSGSASSFWGVNSSPPSPPLIVCVPTKSAEGGVYSCLHVLETLRHVLPVVMDPSLEEERERGNEMRQGEGGVRGREKMEKGVEGLKRVATKLHNLILQVGEQALKLNSLLGEGGVDGSVWASSEGISSSSVSVSSCVGLQILSLGCAFVDVLAQRGKGMRSLLRDNAERGRRVLDACIRLPASAVCDPPLLPLALLSSLRLYVAVAEAVVSASWGPEWDLQPSDSESGGLAGGFVSEMERLLQAVPHLLASCKESNDGDMIRVIAAVCEILEEEVIQGGTDMSNFFGHCDEFAFPPCASPSSSRGGTRGGRADGRLMDAGSRSQKETAGGNGLARAVAVTRAIRCASVLAGFSAASMGMDEGEGTPPESGSASPLSVIPEECKNLGGVAEAVVALRERVRGGEGEGNGAGGGAVAVLREVWSLVFEGTDPGGVVGGARGALLETVSSFGAVGIEEGGGGGKENSKEKERVETETREALGDLGNVYLCLSEDGNGKAVGMGDGERGEVSGRLADLQRALLCL
uniref:Uncharacterized protein n=1 Tax=Chromera velia CCMP2878 TaxID=1169474 RepID=A0A0G4H9I4_9ALVE|eukprot:Cvel_25311.t1-p1 / transcript=Cvel_25311.t1 / gene=Cvel_25311 / organism=Chromera_velia_CCMP2878 / gene_product=hypothetical protein / transcript_product=hypothetical protein / location=Cvel_scaffold2849:1008-5408(+) / protein_length=771 / sequence_SO=supercontig / SO=protein_coding / is_pseudo=false